MAPLITTPNLPETDDFYAALLAAHEGLSEAESARLNARIILTLGNHIGDLEALLQALEVARGEDASQKDPTKA